jgi:hypothetical protein
MVKKAAWENLNKMRNPLVKLDKVLEIYTLKFTTDYNSIVLTNIIKADDFREMDNSDLFQFIREQGD